MSSEYRCILCLMYYIVVMVYEMVYAVFWCGDAAAD